MPSLLNVYPKPAQHLRQLRTKQTRRETYLKIREELDLETAPDQVVVRGRRAIGRMNMMGTRLIVAASVCFLGLGLLVAEINVTGNWDLTVSSRRGERSTTAEFVQNGEDLTGFVVGREGAKSEAKGSVKGNDIEWTVKRETSRGTFEMIYTGKIDGDTMKGTVQFGTRGSGEWTAKRTD